MNPLDSFQNLPTWGKVAIGVGSAGVVYYAYKQHQNAKASSTATDITDPATGTSYSTTAVDPQTGLTYGSEIPQYGSVAAAEAAYGYGTGTATGAQGSGSLPVSANASGVLGTTSGFGSNAAWTQAAEAGLSQIGFDPTTVADALGAYLNNQSLTPTQVGIVNDAISEFGLPPTGSFTTPTATSPNPTTNSDTTTPSGNTTPVDTTPVTTPTPPPVTTATPPQTSSVSNGHVVAVSTNTATIGWSASGPATQWKLVITGPGAINGHVGITNVTQGVYGGLESGHNYEVSVQPLVNGQPSGSPGKIDFKTT